MIHNILQFLHKSAWHYHEPLSTDFEINDEISILFLSIRFHVAKPEYIHRRYKRLAKYKYNILLVRVDSVNYESVLLELFDISNFYKSVIVLCFNDEECGTYLTSFSVKNSNFMRLRKKCDSSEEFLNIIPKINKIDVEKITKKFTNMKQLIQSEGSLLHDIGISDMKTDNFANISI